MTQRPLFAREHYDPERDLVFRARASGPGFKFHLLRELADALERRLDGACPAPAGDEAALRADLDDGPRLTLLAWADLLEERGEAATADGLRWLAAKRKWPGAVAGLYRWAPERFKGNATFSLPAAAIDLIEGREPGAAPPPGGHPPSSLDLAAAVPSPAHRYPALSEALLAAAWAVGRLLKRGCEL